MQIDENEVKLSSSLFTWSKGKRLEICKEGWRYLFSADRSQRTLFIEDLLQAACFPSKANTAFIVIFRVSSEI